MVLVDFCFARKAGVYTVGNDKQMDFVVYVKGGDKININILGKQG